MSRARETHGGWSRLSATVSRLDPRAEHPGTDSLRVAGDELQLAGVSRARDSFLCIPVTFGK